MKSGIQERYRMNWQDRLKELGKKNGHGLEDYIPFITDLLKEQREICAGIFDKPPANIWNLDKHQFNNLLHQKILNAPEPTGEKK